MDQGFDPLIFYPQELCYMSKQHIHEFGFRTELEKAKQEDDPPEKRIQIATHNSQEYYQPQRIRPAVSSGKSIFVYLFSA